MADPQMAPAYDPDYTIVPTSKFHDVIFQLAYNEGFGETQRVQDLMGQLKATLETVGGKKDSLRATIPPNQYGITLLEVGEDLAADQAERVAVTILGFAQAFAEFATLDLTDSVELEPHEKHYTKEQITQHVMFGMVIGNEYQLGKFSRSKTAKM